MECGDAWLHTRESRRFSRFVDRVDSSVPVANEHPAVAVKGDSGRDPQILRENLGFLERRYAINGSFVAARDEHLAVGIERNAGRVDEIAQERFAFAV